MKIETLIDLMTEDVIAYDETGCACKLTKEDKCMIVGALDKQIPRKPKYIENEQPICPICHYFLERKRFRHIYVCDGDYLIVTYCEHCGQKIDWGDE